MVWYADGSIQVEANGQVATGIGTAFLKNVRIGDGLTIAGSASMHEVTNIASDTQLTFSPPYAGAAGAGKQYRIAPIQGYVKEAADRLREVLREAGALITSEALQALADATTDQQRRAAVALGKVDNTADADKPISVAQKSAFDLKVDKVEGRGLSTNDFSNAMKAKLDGMVKTESRLDSTQGRITKVGDYGVGLGYDLRGSILVTGAPSDMFGRGFVSGMAPGGPLGIPGLNDTSYGVLHIDAQYPDASAGRAISRRFFNGSREWVQYAVNSTTWSPWLPIITSASAVGAVSRTAGENSGAVIESGSNANGKYTKFAGGDMWCSASLTTATIGAGAYIDAGITFPAQFSPDDICISCSLVPYGTWDYKQMSGINSLSVNGVGTLRAGINGTTAAQQFAIYWTAKGRWFI